jgi:hypothetical protein
MENLDHGALSNLKVNVDGSLDVRNQDQTTPDISFYLAQILDTITILANTAVDDETLDVETTGSTPVVGNYVCLKEGTAFLQVEIISVTPISGNQYTIGIAIPLDFAFTTAGGCSLQNVDMNVDGSVTPVLFKVSPSGLDDGTEWDITRMIIIATMTSAGDDGKFCNLSALTNGVYFRTKDGITQNLFNAKENADFAEEAAGDLNYQVRSGGGGTHGMRGRITFNGQDKRGVVKRLAATTNDEFQAFVRDDLVDVSLIKLRVKLQGQVVLN